MYGTEKPFVLVSIDLMYRRGDEEKWKLIWKDSEGTEICVFRDKEPVEVVGTSARWVVVISRWVKK